MFALLERMMRWVAVLFALSCAGSGPKLGNDGDEVAGVEIEVTGESCTLDGTSTFFQTNSAVLTPADALVLDSVSACLIGPLAGTAIELVGRTDMSRSVMRYLLHRGVAKNRIVFREEEPGSTPRVDVNILDCTIDPTGICS